jgi:circadian clock protein KaiC
MTGGGVPAGDSVLVTGPTGVGKTILATQFIAAGVQLGERGAIAVFEEHPASYIARARSLGMDLGGMVERGDLEVMYLHPLDLSVDETLQDIRERVERIGARRVVIDSLSGFEVALAPSSRQDFRDSFYRLIQALTALNITVLSTMEATECADYLRFSNVNISFLSDDIISMRFVELEGELRKVLAVIKMRGSAHDRSLRAYDITSHGLEIGEALYEYRGIITGVPELRREVREPRQPELTALETRVLDVILESGEAPAELLARASGVKLEELAPALDRLVAVSYIRATEREGRMLYRATTRAVR